MNSIILIGNKDQSDVYVSDFIQSHAIKPYYIERFSEGLKISHVRELKKRISIKLEESECRLFVIEGSVTIEAQNALLKTLEESASWVYFILVVSSSQDVLATILSRCKLVYLTNELKEKDEVDKQFEALSQNSYSLLYPIFEKYHFFSTIEDVEEFIRSFRKYVVFVIETKQNVSGTLISRFATICEHYSLIKSNNINRRSAVEMLLLNPKV